MKVNVAVEARAGNIIMFNVKEKHCSPSVLVVTGADVNREKYMS